VYQKFSTHKLWNSPARTTTDTGWLLLVEVLAFSLLFDASNHAVMIVDRRTISPRLVSWLWGSSTQGKKRPSGPETNGSRRWYQVQEDSISGAEVTAFRT
jgi:hypothetical protein